MNSNLLFKDRTENTSEPRILVSDQNLKLIETLKIREQYRDRYWQKRDPIYLDRLLWRAQTFRHMVNLLPQQTILEIGAGKGLFTRKLFHVTRGENPITAIKFNSDNFNEDSLSPSVEFFSDPSFPSTLLGRHFDFIVAMDLLDKANCAWFLQNIYKLLKPGGKIVFYESNPWNVVLKLRRFILKCLGTKDPRRLLNRSDLYELISEVGFIRVFAVYNDFVYAPLTRPLMWLFRNLSTLLENIPVIQTIAGSILIHAQKPPRVVEMPKISLYEHEQLKNAISVVIPCHNEEMNIIPLITCFKQFYGDYIHEIILVDDNSQDNTGQIIRRIAEKDSIIKPVFRSPPSGVGRALSDGYRMAQGQYVLSMDCDFQHLLPQLRDLFDAAIEGYDVVVGSRFSRHSVLLNYPFQKIIANRGFHMLAQILLHRRFRDLTNNLKLMRRDVIKKLQLTQPGFAINAETGLQPLLMGFSVKEVPISWINRASDMGISSFNLVKVGSGYWQVLLRLSLKTLFGFKQLDYEKTF